MLITICIVTVVIGLIATYVYLSYSAKKKAVALKPDPIFQKQIEKLKKESVRGSVDFQKKREEYIRLRSRYNSQPPPKPTEPSGEQQ